jgi:hypothetical protein
MFKNQTYFNVFSYEVMNVFRIRAVQTAVMVKKSLSLGNKLHLAHIFGTVLQAFRNGQNFLV